MKKILFLLSVLFFSINAQAQLIDRFNSSENKLLMELLFLGGNKIDNNRIQYDIHDRISRVGDKRIEYDIHDRVSKIGDERVEYDIKDRVRQIGDKRIEYDINGKVSQMESDYLLLYKMIENYNSLLLLP